jgi:hypothetical protein
MYGVKPERMKLYIGLSLNHFPSTQHEACEGEYLGSLGHTCRKQNASDLNCLVQPYGSFKTTHAKEFRYLAKLGGVAPL